MKRHVKRLSGIILAVGLILVGLAFIPLPIPVGAILVLSGTALLVMHSTTFGRFIRFLRSRNSFLNAAFFRISDVMPGTLKGALRLTDP